MTLMEKGLKTPIILWVLAIGMVIFNGMFYMLSLKPKATRLASLEKEYQIKRIEREKPHAINPDGTDRKLERLYKGIPEWEEFTRVMGDIYNKAGNLNLSLESASYKSSYIKDPGLLKIAVSMPVTGSYDGIKRFIYELETSPRFFIIENLSLGSGRGEEGSVSLNLAIVIHFRG